MHYPIYWIAGNTIAILPDICYAFVPTEATIYYRTNGAKPGVNRAIWITQRDSAPQQNPYLHGFVYTGPPTAPPINHPDHWLRVPVCSLGNYICGMALEDPNHTALIIQFLYLQGHIPNVELWGWLSGNDGRLLPASYAKQVYIALGFQPFEGYPLLTHDGKRVT